MSNARPYARFYYGDFKRDYRDIYDDDAAYALFMRLLVEAETSWPADPDLPRSARPRPLAVLVSRGLVTVAGTTYRVRGFLAERTARAESGRPGARKRWESDGNANA